MRNLHLPSWNIVNVAQAKRYTGSFLKESRSRNWGKEDLRQVTISYKDCMTTKELRMILFENVIFRLFLLLFYIRKVGGCLSPLFLSPLSVSLFIGQSSYISVIFVGSY